FPGEEPRDAARLQRGARAHHAEGPSAGRLAEGRRAPSGARLHPRLLLSPAPRSLARPRQRGRRAGDGVRLVPRDHRLRRRRQRHRRRPEIGAARDRHGSAARRAPAAAEDRAGAHHARLAARPSLGAARGAARRAALKIYGVDFTCAPRRAKPITAAAGVLTKRALRVQAVERLESFAAFEALLARPGPWVGGFDFPFSLPLELARDLGWPRAWPQLVAHCTAMSRAALRAAL